MRWSFPVFHFPNVQSAVGAVFSPCFIRSLKMKVEKRKGLERREGFEGWQRRWRRTLSRQ